MPRKTRTPATETLSLKVTPAESRGLRRLLRRHRDRVEKLTGRANVSGLLRLMVIDALDTRSRRLFLTQYRPLQGQCMDLTSITGVELLDNARELFRLQDAGEETEDFLADHFPGGNPFE